MLNELQLSDSFTSSPGVAKPIHLRLAVEPSGASRCDLRTRKLLMSAKLRYTPSDPGDTSLLAAACPQSAPASSQADSRRLKITRQAEHPPSGMENHQTSIHRPAARPERRKV